MTRLQRLLVGVVAASLLLWGGAGASAESLTQPGGRDAVGAPPLASGCRNAVDEYPPAHKGYGLTTLDFISNGTLTNGGVTVTGIDADMCSVFQAPQIPVLTLPDSLFTNPAANAPFNPAQPAAAAVFGTDEIAYATAKLTLNLPAVGTVLQSLLGNAIPSAGELVLTPATLPPSVPCAQELEAAGQPAPSLCALVEQKPTASGGFNLDIVTEAINKIYIPSVASPLIVCTLPPVTIPLTTNSKFFAGSNPAKPILGPLTHALATVVSTPQFKALPAPSGCTVGGVNNTAVTQVISVALSTGTPQFVAPLLLQLSLTQSATGALEAG